MDVQKMLKKHQKAPIEYRRLYDIIGVLMADVGAYGEITLRSDSGFSKRCMDLLKKIDSGMQFDPCATDFIQCACGDEHKKDSDSGAHILEHGECLNCFCMALNDFST